MPRRRTIQAGGTRGTVFRQAAHARLQDARVLLEQRRYSGAIYLAGYAVECLLKWAITERRDCIYLPAEMETHNLGNLMLESGLRRILTHEPELEALFSELADVWGPELRYLSQEPRPDEARRLYQQIAKIYIWIAEQQT